MIYGSIVTFFTQNVNFGFIVSYYQIMDTILTCVKYFIPKRSQICVLAAKCLLVDEILDGLNNVNMSTWY